MVHRWEMGNLSESGLSEFVVSKKSGFCKQVGNRNQEAHHGITIWETKMACIGIFHRWNRNLSSAMLASWRVFPENPWLINPNMRTILILYMDLWLNSFNSTNKRFDFGFSRSISATSRTLENLNVAIPHPLAIQHLIFSNKAQGVWLETTCFALYGVCVSKKMWLCACRKHLIEMVGFTFTSLPVARLASLLLEAESPFFQPGFLFGAMETRFLLEQKMTITL